MKPKEWILNILLSIDQFGNAILRGDPDETISSRAAKSRARGKKWGCYLCKLLDYLDKNHCSNAIDLTRGKEHKV